MNLIKRGEAQLMETNSKGGQIRIGASDTICRYFLVPYLEKFHKEFPGAHIKVTNATSIRCVELLESGQVDLVYVTHTAREKSVRDVLAEIAKGNSQVIACGGGLPTRAEAIAALKASGVVFWLSREPAVIYDTVSMARRPLGQGGKEAFLERFRQREPIYRRWADYIIEGHTLAAEAAGRIAALYERECQA